MTAPTKTSTFRAALIQMRSDRSPQANLHAAAKLIGEAKKAGADYVLTPEMTNVMEARREALFASIVGEDDDTSLATFRELARKLGATRVVDVSRAKLPDVQRELGMREGFDVGLEMSGNPSAFRDMLANMAHGGKIAMLGIPSREINIDWHTVIFNMITIKGIYGREMYETWYKMTVMLQSGLDIGKVITHRFSWKDFKEGFDAMRSGNSGKVILDWTA